MNKLLFVIICVLIFIVFFLLVYIIKTLNNDNSSAKELKMQSKLDAANNENEHLKALLSERIQELNDLRNIIPLSVSIDDNVVKDDGGSNDHFPKLDSKTNPHNLIQSPKISHYYTVPSSNGTFNPLHAKDFDDGNCYYKVEFSETSSTVGVLSYLSSNRDKIAIHAFNDYLTSVCHIEDFSHRMGAQNIQMISPGSVNLINELWTIDINNKVKIRFT